MYSLASTYASVLSLSVVLLFSGFLPNDLGRLPNVVVAGALTTTAPGLGVVARTDGGATKPNNLRAKLDWRNSVCDKVYALDTTQYQWIPW
jgi:hypothetical protein